MAWTSTLTCRRRKRYCSRWDPLLLSCILSNGRTSSNATSLIGNCLESSCTVCWACKELRNASDEDTSEYTKNIRKHENTSEDPKNTSENTSKCIWWNYIRWNYIWIHQKHQKTQNHIRKYIEIHQQYIQYVTNRTDTRYLNESHARKISIVTKYPERAFITDGF